jgi:hypothetical protein
MDLSTDGHEHNSSERLITLSVVAIITLTSVLLMLSCMSPEFSFDEADYVSNITNPWDFLWRESDYNRHGHGPMSIYLAKLGQEVLPAWFGSLERRLRFSEALIGSLAIGFLYWTLRHAFGTSRAAALVGSSLLLFSVIRLEETPIIGPHALMLVSTLAIIGLGYKWRNTPTLQAAIGLGAVIAFGALSMTYVIPAALCWAVAVTLAGRNWIAWDRTQFHVAWSIPVILATAAVIVGALWPPGVLQHVILSNFRWYLHYPYNRALVGDRIFDVTPRWAAIYWLARLDAPILFASVVIILVALWKALRSGRLTSKHIYLGISLVFFLATALAAHLAGARNLLQFLAVLCLATGALWDEALARAPRLSRFGSAGIILLAALNLLWLSQSSSYTPSTSADGYRAFLRENENRLHDKAKALVSGSGILKLYAQEYRKSLAWDIGEVPWTTRSDTPLSPDVKYVLIPAVYYNDMPADHPMRRVVADQWKLVWSHKGDHAWDLRLYENPQVAAPLIPGG